MNLLDNFFCLSSSGTGKTLLARAVASQLDANFLKVIFLSNSNVKAKYIFCTERPHCPSLIYKYVSIQCRSMD